LPASVVIPVHAAGPRLLQCLVALKAQDLPGGLRIILSLDGSFPVPAGVASLADSIVTGVHGGPSAARNRGFRASTDPVILFTDADCVPEAGWAASLTAAVEAGADAVKGVYSSGGARIVQRLQQVEFEERYAGLEPGGAVDMVDTYSSGFRRAALEECGGFDEQFPAADHEDVDLSYRMAERGMILRFEPGARVVHEHRPTLAAYARTKFSRGRWRAVVTRIHPGRSISDRYVTGSLRVQLALCAISPAAALLAFVEPLVPIAWSAAFLFSCIPLIRTALRVDPPVSPLVPAFAFVRGAALVCGLCAGAIRGGAA